MPRRFLPQGRWCRRRWPGEHGRAPVFGARRAPCPIDAERVEIVTPDCTTSYPCWTSFAPTNCPARPWSRSEARPRAGTPIDAPPGWPVRGASVCRFLL